MKRIQTSRYGDRSMHTDLHTEEALVDTGPISGRATFGWTRSSGRSRPVGVPIECPGIRRVLTLPPPSGAPDLVSKMSHGEPWG